MAQSKPLDKPLAAGKFPTMRAEEDVMGFLRNYYKDSICIEFQKFEEGFRPGTSKELATEVMTNLDIPVAVIVSKKLNNGGNISKGDMNYVEAIEKLRSRVKDLKNCKDAFLLVCLPLLKQYKVPFRGTTYTEVFFEGQMRKSQMKTFQEDHPGINLGLQSNAAVVEILNKVDLKSALDDFVRKMCLCPYIKAVTIVFNGHGSSGTGDLGLHDGNSVSMINILQALQIFRLELFTEDRAEELLPELHIVFAQCYSYELNWAAALRYNLITDVVWLTENKDGYRQTMNRTRPDGQEYHVELTELATGTRDFQHLQSCKKDYSQLPQDQLQAIAETLDGLRLVNIKGNMSSAPPGVEEVDQ